MFELIQTSGYSGTGLDAVIEACRSTEGIDLLPLPPTERRAWASQRSSLPRSSRTLIAEAAVSAGSAAEAARTVIEALVAIVSESNFRLVSPVSVVTLEMGAESERLRQACAVAFESWIAPTVAFLEASGLDAREARSLATVLYRRSMGRSSSLAPCRAPNPCFRR